MEGEIYLFEEAESDTGTEELAKVFLRELFEGLEDVTFDLGGNFCGVSRIVRNNGGSKIGAIDRVVNGDGDLKGLAAGKDRACNTSPHRLDKRIK